MDDKVCSLLGLASSAQSCWRDSSMCRSGCRCLALPAVSLWMGHDAFLYSISHGSFRLFQIVLLRPFSQMFSGEHMSVFWSDIIRYTVSFRSEVCFKIQTQRCQEWAQRNQWEGLEDGLGGTCFLDQDRRSLGGERWLRSACVLKVPPWRAVILLMVVAQHCLVTSAEGPCQEGTEKHFMVLPCWPSGV